MQQRMNIKNWRAEIDLIDAELLRLLNLRAQAAVKIGEAKRAAGLPIIDKEREAKVLQRVVRLNQGFLNEASVVKLFRRIICESRRTEARHAQLQETSSVEI